MLWLSERWSEFDIRAEWRELELSRQFIQKHNENKEQSKWIELKISSLDDEDGVSGKTMH